jgi:hypothetical protein
MQIETHSESTSIWVYLQEEKIGNKKSAFNKKERNKKNSFSQIVLLRRGKKGRIKKWNDESQNRYWQNQ